MLRRVTKRPHAEAEVQEENHASQRPWEAENRFTNVGGDFVFAVLNERGRTSQVPT